MEKENKAAQKLEKQVDGKEFHRTLGLSIFMTGNILLNVSDNKSLQVAGAVICGSAMLYPAAEASIRSIRRLVPPRVKS